MTLETVIPPGATALVHLPTTGLMDSGLTIHESGKTIWKNGTVAESAPLVAFERNESVGRQRYSVWRVSSGTYQFKLGPAARETASRSSSQ